MTHHARLAPLRPDGVAARTLWLVMALLGANIVFNLVAGALGWPAPYRSFLPDAVDLFGDYFKFILSFPGGDSVPLTRVPLLHDRIAYQMWQHPYADVTKLSRARLTHLHTPPLTVAICFANISLMRALDEVAVLALTILGLAGFWCALAAQASVDRRAVSTWCLVGLASYPMLVMVDRGNIYAGLTALLILQALILALKGRAPLIAGLCLAVAVNIRPNAIVFALPLLLFPATGRWRALASLAISGSMVQLASYAIAHGLYPGYTFTTFRAGLDLYYDHYIREGYGVAGGSSLYGGIAFFVGYHPAAPALAGLVAVALLAGTLWRHAQGRLSRTTLLFLICAVYALGSTIIGDYHLIVFLIVPIAASRAERLTPADTIAWLASCLILAPKDYAFSGDTSWQVVLNPAILLAAAVAILALSAAPKQRTDCGSSAVHR